MDGESPGPESDGTRTGAVQRSSTVWSLPESKRLYPEQEVFVILLMTDRSPHTESWSISPPEAVTTPVIPSGLPHLSSSPHWRTNARNPLTSCLCYKLSKKFTVLQKFLTNWRTSYLIVTETQSILLYNRPRRYDPNLSRCLDPRHNHQPSAADRYRIHTLTTNHPKDIILMTSVDQGMGSGSIVLVRNNS
jgi:hypothetical protein